MAGRGLSVAQTSALNGSDIGVALFVYLDIKDDPVVAWTGLGDYTSTTTPDAIFNGLTFTGIANLGELGKLLDSTAGSDTTTLTLPGIDLNSEALRQVVFNRSTWQFRKAYIWLGLFDPSMQMITAPNRFKVGRMDNMELVRSGTEGTIKVSIESFAAYQQETLFSRYSEQKSVVDNTDISQDWAASLANQTAIIGVRDASNSNSGGGSSGGGGGSLSGPSGQLHSV